MARRQKKKCNRKQGSKNQRSKKPRNRQQRYQKQRENYCSQQDFENIQITDDFMFGTVFSDKDDCKEFLQRILQIRILEIRIVTPQQSIRNRKDGKGIRLDVYVRDDQGNSYDIEMQLLDTKELDLRSRYYHSEMDTYQIRKGKKYKNLKESIVIFVCGFDPFDENRSIYTFETICRENTDIRLKDKRKTYFVYIGGNRDGVAADTIKLLDYFKTGEPTDEFTVNLQNRVEQIRCDDEWRENHMTLEMKMDEMFDKGVELGEQCGMERGLERGTAETEQKLINNLMVNMNITKEEAKERLGIS
ncbi:MAG: Rpn family recombination-promoting nuclease/putative transposase [Lachnospiraceae bacterium]|nr:Rpn family recombination-promoting nuclease/putative transposase [Lachnospiraceae bacterium]